ncbi:MAG: TonB-dependent receptor [Lentimicrobium sp.]|jgi:TonB-linked SusC/RagA family outer membrane protein|nr:TonB-dependent receptor [Lentimicrobium sp.]
MTKKFYFLIILFLMAAVSVIYGQTINVSGTITGNDGDPIPGASIVLKGTTTGVISNLDGMYSIAVPELKGTLVISFIGYQTREIAITGRVLNVILSESTEVLDELVVVGFGTQKKVNLTGAVSSVSMKELEGKPVVNIVEALQGSTPGLIIQQSNSQPGNRPSINIRGQNTLNNNDPLILIDGIVGDIQNVNPSDIKNISILKDASSTAIYGSRASNGVILIETNSGSGGKTTVRYDYQYGVQQVTALPTPVDSWIYAELRNEALVNSGRPIAFTPDQIAQYRNGGTNVSWIDAIYKPLASQQSHNVSFSGGTDKTSMLFSVGYLDQNSLLQGPDYGLKRLNARLNVDHQVNKNLKISANVAYARNTIKDHAYWTEWIIEQVVRMPTIYAIKEDGKYTYPSGSNSNSLARLETGGYRQNKNDDLSGVFNAELSIFEGLKLKGMIGGQLYNNRMHQNRNEIPGSGDQENSLQEDFGRNENISSNIMLTYDKKLKDHTLAALLGYSYEGGQDNSFSTYRKVASPDFDIMAGSQATDVTNQGWASDWSIYSQFMRLNYNFKEKYLFEFNIRNDMSSKFSKSKRSALFPSLSAAWRVSEESFYNNFAEIIPSLKIRSSWGLVGNNRISDYAYIPSVSITNGYVFNNVVVGTSNISAVNTDIRWETTRMFNVGTDIGLLNNALNFTFDYFQNLTYDILIGLPVPTTFGGGNPIQNAGTVQNAGWEASINYNYTTGKVKHSLSANLSDSRNKVIDTHGKEWINGYDINTIIREGYAINSYYAYRSDGYFQNEEEVLAGPYLEGVTPKPGDIRYIDKDGDGVIKPDDDRFVLGNQFPRLGFGLNYSFSIQGFDFSMLWQGVGQRSVWLRGESVEAFHNNNEGPVFNYHIDRWTPNNPDASYPRLTVGAESTNNAAKSDFWIQDGAYARLKNLQFGYTIPSAWTKKLAIENVRVFVSGQNLLTLSKMVGGWDPETTGSTGGRIYPVAKIMSIGLSVKL